GDPGCRTETGPHGPDNPESRQHRQFGTLSLGRCTKRTPITVPDRQRSGPNPAPDHPTGGRPKANPRPAHPDPAIPPPEAPGSAPDPATNGDTAPAVVLIHTPGEVVWFV